MKAFRIIGIIFTMLVAFLLVLAAIAPFVSPKDFWPLAFFGLAFPFLFVGNILTGIAWAVLKKKRALVCLTALLLTSFYVPRFFQIGAIQVPASEVADAVNVVSFNTHYMGAYDFAGGDSSFFFRMMDTLRPDIICLQEFANLGGNYEKPMFKKFFKQYKSYYNVNADALSNTFPTGYGVCIFSRYPIVKKGFLELENQNSNLTVFADILYRKDTLRIVNTHLKSIVFDKEDYRTMEELKAIEESPETYKLRRIMGKLKYAFLHRARQAEKVREKLIHCPYKIILCGDFNDAPSSYAYETIRGNLKDAYCESGKGMSRTYIGKMPSFRIDYILHDPSWKSYHYQTNTINFSDHKMVSCSVVIP